MYRWRWFILLILTAGVGIACSPAQDTRRQWLAGDTHIHSQWSPAYDRTKTPPEPIPGRDGRYPTPVNAQKAREFGLRWMVTTDHGGPNHSKFNLEHAYAELLISRRQVPEVLQFYGMELNMPAMGHHTLIIPYGDQESSMLYDIESQFDRNDPWPRDPSRNTEAFTRRALEHMQRLPRLPLVFANHPSRSARGIGQYGANEPREFRKNMDLAPDVYKGMEGGPGHQATTLAPDGTPRLDDEGRPRGFRGGYRRPGAHTLGGYDQMTAIVGGLWDSMLGEGRRFWILASSDSHVNYADSSGPGSDFWPGEFHKTYVHAEHSYEGIAEGLRSGRIFTVAGDLVSELDVVAESGAADAGMGGALAIEAGADVTVTVRFRIPDTPNANGENPTVARVDVIMGDVRGPVSDPSIDRNETTRVIARFTENDWMRNGDVVTMSTTLRQLDRSVYVRVRGTNTQDAEPVMDTPGENPWRDLWFYSSPVFVEVR